MPHAVESIATSGFTPWWVGLPDAGRLAINDGEMTKDVALEKSELGLWEPRLVPMHIGGGEEVPGWSAVQKHYTDEGVALGREDAIIGCVRSTYTIIPNAEVFDLASKIVDSTEANIVSAGSLLGGRVVFVLVRLGKHIQIIGDPSKINPYLGIVTGHDGMRSLRAAIQPVRWECQNTVNAGLARAHRTKVIRHTTNGVARVGEIRKTLGVTFEYLETFETVMNGLAKEKLTKADLVAFTEEFLPIAPTVENPVRTENMRDELLGVINGSDNLRELPMTAWRVYNGVAEWADHGRTYRDGKMGGAADNRAIAILDERGTAVTFKDRALRILAPAVAAKK